jgi:serine protease Do
MKTYPHTDSTDMVVYECKEKKSKKPNVVLTAICSALAASVFTAAIFTTVTIAYTKQNQPTVTQKASAGAVSASNATNAITTAATTSGNALTIPEIAEKCGSSVVGVINKTTVQSQRFYDPFTGRYYYTTPQASDGSDTVEQGSGSGIIISADGYIVTNQHVINGATEISIILNTGDELTATIVGQDTRTDLAVLKVDTDKELNPATLGDSENLRVGELAVAIGNPLGQEYSGSVTAGIISAVNRTLTIENRTYNLIQTDAAINPGNSGGALFNQFGEVIGINSVKLSTTEVEGMGFAIAISEAKPIIDDLINSGYVTGRPLVGIGVSQTRYGLFIGSVQEGSGAAEAGLQEGDMILEVDGTKVSSSTEINNIRDKKKPGDKLTFKILRDGATQEVEVTLKESPAETAATANPSQNG